MRPHHPPPLHLCACSAACALERGLPWLWSNVWEPGRWGEPIDSEVAQLPFICAIVVWSLGYEDSCSHKYTRTHTHICRHTHRHIDTHAYRGMRWRTSTGRHVQTHRYARARKHVHEHALAHLRRLASCALQPQMCLPIPVSVIKKLSPRDHLSWHLWVVHFRCKQINALPFMVRLWEGLVQWPANEHGFLSSNFVWTVSQSYQCTCRCAMAPLCDGLDLHFLGWVLT